MVTWWRWNPWQNFVNVSQFFGLLCPVCGGLLYFASMSADCIKHTDKTYKCRLLRKKNWKAIFNLVRSDAFCILSRKFRLFCHFQDNLIFQGKFRTQMKFQEFQSDSKAKLIFPIKLVAKPQQWQQWPLRLITKRGQLLSEQVLLCICNIQQQDSSMSSYAFQHSNNHYCKYHIIYKHEINTKHL